MIDFIKDCIKEEIVEFENNTRNFNPTVTVCVQTYQHVNYIGQCLDGILMQKTNFKFEIILGEDESNDGTREICIEYAKKYPDKIRLFLHSRKNVIHINGAPTGRFNFFYNISKARGRYIALCEGDDYWTDPNKLQKQVDFLESNPDFAMSSHAVKTVFEGVKEKDPFVKPIDVTNFDDIVENGHFIPTLSIVFRREALPEIPDWLKDLWAGDIPLVLLLSHYGKNYYFKDVMGLKRKHKGGMTQQLQRKNLDFKYFYIENRLFFLKKLNKFFKYEHKNVLNPIIAKHNLYILPINIKKGKIGLAICNILESFIFSPKIFFKEIFNLKILMNISR